MGVRGFMGYMLKHGCVQTGAPLTQLAHKTLAIDAMNCLYGLARKYGDCVPQHFDDLCRVLQRNKVNGLLVFDGIPDANRKLVRDVRAIERRERVKEFTRRQNMTGSANARALNRLAYQLAAPKPGDIKHAQIIAEARHMGSYFCDGEADEVCARLARNSSGGAAASTDTDILAFGAPIMVFDICPESETYSAMNLKTVLKNMGTTMPQFHEVCALAGTDKSPVIAPFRTLVPVTSGPDVSLIAEYETMTGRDLTRTRNVAKAYAMLS